MGDVGQPQCSEDHRPWRGTAAVMLAWYRGCHQWTHEYAMTIRCMGAWSWYRRSSAGSVKEKPLPQVGGGILRNPELDMQGKACWLEDCASHASKGCISRGKVMCGAHARTCVTCTEGWWCDTCLAVHVSSTCSHTAQGLRLEEQGRIPRTPHDGIAVAYRLLQNQDTDKSAFDGRGFPEGGPLYSEADTHLDNTSKTSVVPNPTCLLE